MAGILTLTFSASGVADESFDITGGGKLLTFKTVRLASNQVTIETDLAKQVYQFYEAFVLDYNEDEDYTVEYSETEVIITHFDNDHFDSYIDSSASISAAITTTTQEVILDYTVDFNEASADKNVKVNTTLEFNQNIDGLALYEVNDGVETEIYNNASFGTDTHDIEINRASQFLKVVTTLDSVDNSLLYEIPSPLSISEVEVSGNDILITTNVFLGSDENTYTITLSGDTASSYGTSANFTSLTANDYTAWATDKYGAVVSYEITIETTISTDNKKYNLFVSQKNSAYFAEKSFERTNPLSVLSNDDPYPIKAEGFYQVFHDEQIITNQFKSSYPINKAYLYLCPNSIITLPVIKASDNIKRYVYMDANIVEIEPPYIAIRFTPGNYYNANGTVIGQHTFNNTLPSFFTLGTKVQVYGINGIITGYNSTSLDVSFAAFTNIIPNFIDSNPTTIRVEISALDYDVYEVKLPLSSYLDKTFKLRLQGLKAANKGVQVLDAPSDFISENIKVISKEVFDTENWHQCVFFNVGNDTEIDYSKKYNNDGDLTLPIKHNRNLEYEFPLRPLSSAEIETLKLDHRVTKVDYSSMFLVETRLKPLPMMYAYSITKMFNECEYVDIDGIVYTTAPGTKAELDYKGQYAVPKATLAAVGRANEFYYENNSIESFYPVVVD